MDESGYCKECKVHSTVIEDHKTICPYGMIACNFQCGEIFPRSKWYLHVPQCKLYQVYCIHCHDVVLQSDVLEHWKIHYQFVDLLPRHSSHLESNCIDIIPCKDCSRSLPVRRNDKYNFLAELSKQIYIASDTYVVHLKHKLAQWEELNNDDSKKDYMYPEHDCSSIIDNKPFNYLADEDEKNKTILDEKLKVIFIKRQLMIGKLTEEHFTMLDSMGMSRFMHILVNKLNFKTMFDEAKNVKTKKKIYTLSMNNNLKSYDDEHVKKNVLLLLDDYLPTDLCNIVWEYTKFDMKCNKLTDVIRWFRG